MHERTQKRRLCQDLKTLQGRLEAGEKESDMLRESNSTLRDEQSEKEREISKQRDLISELELKILTQKNDFEEKARTVESYQKMLRSMEDNMSSMRQKER